MLLLLVPSAMSDSEQENTSTWGILELMIALSTILHF